VPTFLLGIDIGTTACKTSLFDFQGRIVARASREYPILYPKPMWAEQDPDEWWEATKANIKAVLKMIGNYPEKILGIGIDSQREAPILLDCKGKKLANSIIWLDQRAIPQAKRIASLVSRKRIIEKTGVPIDYLYSAAKIMWLRDERPHVFNKTKCILFPKDYISFKLTGQKATDYSMASRTMLFDIHEKKWSDEICDTLDLNTELLPQPFESSETIGEISSEASALTGLRAGTPVVAGGGDRPCESLGAGVTEPGHFNIGTGTATVMTTPLSRPKVDRKGGVSCCCHVVPELWEYEIIISTTGASLKWFRDNFSYEELETAKKTGVDPYVYLDSLAANVGTGSEGLFFYPYPLGAIGPGFFHNTKAKAVFFGITLTHTKSHFVRSIFEGIAFQYAETVKSVESLGLKMRQASIVGGEARSELWNQIKADVLGRPITQTVVEDAAALGSAILSSVGSGVYSSVAKAAKKMVTVRRVFKPQTEEHRKYSLLLERYKQVYRSLEDAYKAMV
jgi:xylulokinase